MSSGGSSVLAADWPEAAKAVIARGWVRLVEAVAIPVVQALLDTRRPAWHPLPEEEGVVRQHGSGSYLPVDDAEATVRNLATEIVASLTDAMAVLGVVQVPPFNEVTWTHYPDGRGHITAHRDPPAYGGVIAVVTLEGSARFRVWEDHEGSRVEEWPTGTGDIVVLRGHGWPRSDLRCPRHEVDPPAQGDRMIMTLRHNTRGPGGGYDLKPSS